MSKHYIKIDANDFITKVFSTDFEMPEPGDIEVADTDERHFNMDLSTPEGFLKKKWDGTKIIDAPQNEIYTLDRKKVKKKIELEGSEREKAIKALYENKQTYKDKIKAVDDAVDESELDAI